MTPVLLVRERLRRAVGAAQDIWVGPAVWGKDDCALACANVLRPVLGYDPAARWRGRYTTPRGYMRVLRNDGHARLDDAIRFTASEHDWKEISPADAQAGDVGVMPHECGRTAALAMGNGYWIARHECGFAVAVTEQIETAFQVI